MLGDIRLDIDEVLASARGAPLRVVNLEHGPGFAGGRRPLDLVRGGGPISFASHQMPELIDVVSGLSPGTSMLVTDLRIADLRTLAPHLPAGPRVLGFRREIGFWILLGAAAGARPPEWRSPKARPWGCRPALLDARRNSRCAVTVPRRGLTKHAAEVGRRTQAGFDIRAGARLAADRPRCKFASRWPVT